ncbi:MAG TPA: flavin reductase family protein [Nevskiaceae bacterium]
MTDAPAAEAANPESSRGCVRTQLDRARFRAALSRFPTGVSIVTFDGPEQRHGMTANSFTAVSIDPPLVLVCVARNATTHDLMRDRPFTVNILGAEEERLALHFAGRPSVKPEWIEDPVAPRLAGCLAWFACAPWAAYDGGDHTLYVGKVMGFDYRGGDALGFVNSRFTVISEASLGVEFLL